MRNTRQGRGQELSGSEVVKRKKVSLPELARSHCPARRSLLDASRPGCLPTRHVIIRLTNPCRTGSQAYV